MSHDRNTTVIPDDSREAIGEEAYMPVTIELSDDVLKDPSGDISREILEQVAVEGYKQERFSSAQVGRILGFTTPMQVDEFLKKHGVFFDYTEEDFRMDEETSRWLRQQTR
jgi:predicted HTH domain antitoxin